MAMFHESFDPYPDTSNTLGINSRWGTVASGTNELNLQAGRYGGQSVECYGAAIGSGHYRTIWALLGFETDEFSLNIGIYPESGGGEASHIMLCIGTTVQIGIRINFN